MTKLFTTLLITGYFLNLTFFAKAQFQGMSLTTPECKENGQELINESFNSKSTDWKDIYLKGTKEGGKYSIRDGKLIVNAASSKSIYGVYHPTPLSGHFYAEVEFDKDDNCELALVHAKNGVPDPDNFTSICVNTNKEGKVVVQVFDRQNGKDNVFDNTGKLGPERYKTILENQYSVPYDCTNKKIRIFRDGPAGFFHFYYAVKKKIRGEWAEGWMELAPSKVWGEPGQKYYVALCANSYEGKTAQISFYNLRVMQKPTEDRNDAMTGFKATKREYNWSGFFGDAVVISFGEEFDFHESDQKVVFWSEANYIPAWHMNNQLLYFYEFLETWGGGSQGCFEPMSDRLKRWSRVEILEDNPVRKIIHWHYVLCDPDYKVPENSVGRQLPEADEYWTFYPDGTGLRHIVYTPKLDSEHRSWHELTELIIVAGSSTNPVDHAAVPALSVLNLNGNMNEYHQESKSALDRRNGTGNGFEAVPDAEVNQWEQIIAVAHFKDAPDAFIAYSHSEDIPETYSHYKIRFEVSWHGTHSLMSHWPVGLEPYQRGFTSRSDWKGQVTHSCLMGGGIREGKDWKDHYKIDHRGRKYREWVALVGLNEPGNLESIQTRTSSWLYPGSIEMLNSESRYVGINYKRGEMVFDNLDDACNCQFSITPGKHGILVNPVFKINDWFHKHPIQLTINDQLQTPGKDYKTAYESDAAVIWIKRKFDSSTTFHISEGL